MGAAISAHQTSDGSAAEPTPAEAARRRIRAGLHEGHTAGMAPDFVQGNVAILPHDLAADFANYCQRNPKPCPLPISGVAAKVV